MRVIATLFIVFYHCCCPYTTWTTWGGYCVGNPVNDILYWVTLDCVYDCMLPTFFMLSGMVYFGRKECYADRIQAIWKKVDRLLIPFTIMACVNLALGIGNPTVGHLWFLKVLFVYYFISLLLYKIKEKWLLLLSICLHLIYMASIKNGLLLQMPEEVWRGLRYYLYFVIGHYANVYYNLLHRNTKAKLVVILVAALTLIFNNKIYTQFIYSLAFNAFLICFINNEQCHSNLWRSLNINSFAIYLLHHPFILVLFATPFFQYLYSTSVVLSISLMFILSLGISWLISTGLHRIGFRYF